MRYFVPQIKHDTKIGGMTFHQLTYVLISIGLILGTMFATGSNLAAVVVVAVITMPIAIFLSFGSIRGTDVPSFIKSFVSQVLSPNIYRWQKRTIITKPIEHEEPPKEEIKKKEIPKVLRRSSIQELSKRNI